MSIKFHWGMGLAIALGTFVAIMIGFLVWGMQAGSKVAAEERIYEKSLVYQAELDKKNAAASLKEKPRLQLAPSGRVLVLDMPQPASAGQVRFLRGNDPTMDRDFALQLDANQRMHIPREELARGRWNVKLYWTLDGKDYLHEQVLVLPDIPR